MNHHHHHHHHNKNLKATQVQNADLFCVTKRIHFDSIDSTNTWAKNHSQHWASEGVTLVTAKGQTAGRGRFKRRWESPSHVNIYATFCFWIDDDQVNVGLIPQILALATVKILEKLECPAQIKWPNDLFINGKKMGGILCETISKKQKKGIICGIGLNVNMPQEALDQIDRPATSLLVEKCTPFDVENILEAIQQTFTHFLDRLVNEGFAPFFAVLQQKCYFQPEQHVQFHDNRTVLEGRFRKLHPDGSVELDLKDGTSKRFYSGEFMD
jgi:BirA family transcriptional regulator, biotin operon repressor / biotin---[acetyl-CoA-carboxylase] ligase